MRALFFAILLLLPLSATAAPRIDAFSSHYTLEEAGSILVQEEIVYDHGADAAGRHGIFRKVPLVFRDPVTNVERIAEVSSITVTDGEGNTIPTSYAGGGNIMQLKIGDPDVEVSGRKRYVIRYTLWGLIDHDNLRYDTLSIEVTGRTWDVPIDMIRADMKLPIPLPERDLTASCEAGVVGAMETCETAILRTAGADMADTVRYQFEKGIAPRHGMTITLTLPKGAISPPDPIRSKRLAESVTIYHWWRKAPGTYVGLGLLLPAMLGWILVRTRKQLFGAHPQLPGTHLMASSLLALAGSLFLPYLNLPLALMALILGGSACSVWASHWIHHRRKKPLI
jgi:hypothetical protein